MHMFKPYTPKTVQLFTIQKLPDLTVSGYFPAFAYFPVFVNIYIFVI